MKQEVLLAGDRGSPLVHVRVDVPHLMSPPQLAAAAEQNSTLEGWSEIATRGACISQRHGMAWVEPDKWASLTEELRKLLGFDGKIVSFSVTLYNRDTDSETERWHQQVTYMKNG